MMAGGLLIVAAAIFLLVSKSPLQNVAPIRIGSSLGDFKLTDLDGKTVHLSDYRGHPVLVNAWATWCPPCKAEMPLLNQYYLAHKGQGLALLAINAGDTRNEAASFASQNHLAFPVLLDPGTNLLGQIVISSFPTSILIGNDGIIKKIHIGMFTPDSIEAEVSPLLQ